MMISHPKIALKGFSLLEILLALCILAALTASFVDYLQKREQQNIVATAAKQINTILTAATQYQTTYIAWPSSLSLLIPFNNAISLSSPWHNNTGTNKYVLASAPTSHYFSLQVTVPNVNTAQKLITALPNAYFSVSGNQVLVTAYTTAFIQSNYPPHPTGVLYGSAASTAIPNPSPNFNAVPYAFFPQTGTSKVGPFGIINVNQIASNNSGKKPKDQGSASTTFNQTYTPIMNYNDAPIGSKFTLGTEMPACPNGSIATAVLFPVILRQDKPNSFWSWAQTAGFASVYTHLVLLDSNTFSGCINAGFPYYNQSSSASKQMDSYVGFTTDMVCLPNDNIAMSRWPDMTAGSAYCPPNSGGL